MRNKTSIQLFITNIVTTFITTREIAIQISYFIVFSEGKMNSEQIIIGMNL